MSSVNKVILVGTLGRDPEVRHTTNSTVANLNVATNEKWKDKSGDYQQKTEWHRVVVWGKPAEFAEKYLRKGDSVYIEGKLETRKWNDKDGNEKYTTEIVVDMRGQVQALGGRKNDEKPSESDPVKPDSNDMPFDDTIPW